MRSDVPVATYDAFAAVYDRLVESKDYAQSAAYIERLIDAHSPGAATLLDVACGTGRHLARFRRRFDVEGLDLSEGMLEVARARLPGIVLHGGSMVDFDLGKCFDVVTCLFASIGHVGTHADLANAVATMARHARPGGLVIVEPWLEPDAFDAGRLVMDTVDEPDIKVSRTYVAERVGGRCVYEMHYVIGIASGVRSFVVHDELGLFTKAEYLSAISGANLQVVHDDLDGPFGYGLYVCRV